MKKKTLMLSCIAAVAIVAIVGTKNCESQVYETNDLLRSNIEALSTGTEADDDCDYKNGYTAFTNKKGGAYDCCRVWVNYAPKDEHYR